MIEGLKPLYNALLRPFSRVLARMGVHPNIVTISGVIIFLAGGWYTALGHWITGVLIIAAGALLDGLDGLLAREMDKRSSFGAVLDSLCDRLTEILWLGSILVYYMRYPIYTGLCVYLAFAALTGSLLVSYVKARAEGAGIACNKGILQRPERIIILGICQLAGPEIMPWGLGIIAVFSYLTVIQRTLLVWRNYKKLNVK